jgi:hypothetical protein
MRLGRRHQLIGGLGICAARSAEDFPRELIEPAAATEYRLMAHFRLKITPRFDDDARL